MTDLRSLKSNLRRAMRARRAEAHRQNPEAALALRDLFFDAVELPERAVVSGYVARDFEIDPYPLMDALHRRGHGLCLPVVGSKGEPLTFRVYNPGDLLIPAGKLPIPEPPAAAAGIEPDIILAPLLAFDIRGNRLGQGAGYYDRTLTELRKRRKIIAIGVAFDCQQVDEVPAGPLDAMLDKVITETQAYALIKPS